jgi:hypothetical protein
MDLFADRLYHCLLDALRERGITEDGRPVTVAEIYQELVPYRTVRERVGVDLNADYEHALLRLLAGEGDRLRLEPPAAQEELKRELGSNNPYVGIYRKFAACDVWVRVAAVADDEAGEGARGPVDSGAAPALARPVAVPAAGSPSAEPAPRPAAPARPAAATPVAPPPAPGSETGCPFCREALPGGRMVRFCPHCGRDQRLRPCAGCGEALDRAWRYCIACGVPVQLTAHPGKVPG